MSAVYRTCILILWHKKIFIYWWSHKFEITLIFVNFVQRKIVINFSHQRNWTKVVEKLMFDIEKLHWKFVKELGQVFRTRSNFFSKSMGFFIPVMLALCRLVLDSLYFSDSLEGVLSFLFLKHNNDILSFLPFSTKRTQLKMKRISQSTEQMSWKNCVFKIFS